MLLCCYIFDKQSCYIVWGPIGICSHRVFVFIHCWLHHSPHSTQCFVLRLDDACNSVGSREPSIFSWKNGGYVMMPVGPFTKQSLRKGPVEWFRDIVIQTMRAFRERLYILLLLYYCISHVIILLYCSITRFVY